MAPPNKSNFSVSVVLPASGWLMIAKVLLLLISLFKSIDNHCTDIDKLSKTSILIVGDFFLHDGTKIVKKLLCEQFY
jgi:secreted Zn-dependent insulinase-like peptidase